jgi:hypothetical protein
MAPQLGQVCVLPATRADSKLSRSPNWIIAGDHALHRWQRTSIRFNGVMFMGAPVRGHVVEEPEVSSIAGRPPARSQARFAR